MGEFKFETQGTSSFLTYCLDEDEQIDTMSMGMISNNHIDGVLPFQYLQIDRERYFKYNISSTVSLTHYLSGLVNRKQIIGVMTNIADTVLNAEDYMLEAGAFIWDKEYIFVNMEGNRTQMICVPVVSEGRAGSEDIEQFLRQLLLSVQFDQNENCDYVARLLAYFNANLHFSLSNFKQLLNQLNYGGYTPAAGRSVAPEPVRMDANVMSEQQEAVKPQPSVDTQVKKQVSTPVPSPAPQTDLKLSFAIPNANATRQTEEPPKDIKKKTKGFSLFGKKEKENKQAQTQPVQQLPKTEPQQAAATKKTKGNSNPYGAFGTMRIPGQDQMVINATPQPQSQAASVQSQAAPVQPQASASKFQMPGMFGGKTAKSSKKSVTTEVFSQTETEDRTEIIDDDHTEILDDSVTQIETAGAWLELISATQSGAMERIDLNFQQASVILGRHSSDEQQPDIAFPAEFKKIGRKHARIERRGQDFYLTDLGSVNHTLLDGKVLTPQQPYLLTEGMELTLTSGKTVQYRVHLQ